MRMVSLVLIQVISRLLLMHEADHWRTQTKRGSLASYVTAWGFKVELYDVMILVIPVDSASFER